MIKAENITKSFRKPNEKDKRVEAVKDISLEINDYDVVAIVGESGSGKSTLARMLAFIDRPDYGSITVDKLEVTNCTKKELAKSRRIVQLVMQDAASSMDPHQKIKEILAEPLKLLLQMDKKQQKQYISQLLDVVCLEKSVLEKYPNELSGGQQKRVCIARALAAKPTHIIFDESFSGLDVTLKKQILCLLKDIRKEMQISYLIITHDLAIAMYMADAIYVMRSGKIVETVKNPKSYSDFENSYSRELVNAVLSKRLALQ